MNVFQSLSEEFPKEAGAAICASVTRHLEEAEQAKANNPHWSAYKYICKIFKYVFHEFQILMWLLLLFNATCLLYRYPANLISISKLGSINFLTLVRSKDCNFKQQSYQCSLVWKSNKISKILYHFELGFIWLLVWTVKLLT